MYMVGITQRNMYEYSPPQCGVTMVYPLPKNKGRKNDSVSH